MRQEPFLDDRVRPDGRDRPHPRRRRVGVIPAAVVAFLLLAGLILVQRLDLDDESSRVEAVAVSEKFIEAHNSRDHETARSLVADTALISMNPAFAVDDLEMGMAWLDATGWVITTNGCTVTRRPSAAAEDPIHVLCALAHENAWSKAIGLEPDRRGGLTLDVASGEIDSALLSFAPMGWPNEAVQTFEDWLAETHPDDLEQMYVYQSLPALTSESITLWSQHTDEFVQAQRG